MPQYRACVAGNSHSTFVDVLESDNGLQALVLDGRYRLPPPHLSKTRLEFALMRPSGCLLHKID